MPPGYDVHDQKIQVWLPLTIDPANPGGRGGHFLYLVGRLKQGVALAQAKADVETMLQKWETLNPGTHVPNRQNHRIRLDALQEDLVGSIKTPLWILQGAVAFVLLIACANLANLLLARAQSRHREFAIRTALGAARSRLLRQFLTEGVVLALAGGAVGAAIGFGGLRALLAANPDSIPRATEITMDRAVLLFTIVVSVVTGLVFGMTPLLHLREQAVTMALKESGQRSTAGSARARVRSGLVMAEVALAVVLVIGAGLLLRSFWNLMTVDAGFNRSHLITFGVVLPSSTYRTPQSTVDFIGRLTTELSSQSGVQGVAAMSGLPPVRLVNANDTDFEGYEAPKEGPFENVDYYQTVTPDYLTPRNMNVVMRTSLGPEVLAPHIRRIVQGMDPTLPVINLRSMDDVFGEAMSRPRFLAQLLGIFAGLALLLASIGTYGILSYSVSERRREIGIHMALGAGRGNVLSLILAQGLRLTVVGLVVGLAAAFGLTRLLRGQLFNVTPSDPATLAGVAAFIALVALVACYIPASRATRVDPMVVLRDE
jgi:predicted lysophospholipase L1 biosynthesis ABC-type transport system permease subunit